VGCHLCADELYSIALVLGGAKLIPGWIRAVWSKRHQKPACRHDHEHTEGPYR